VFAGEVGLGGEIRPVGQLERRVTEASRLGFVRAFVPAAGGRFRSNGLDTVAVPDLHAFVGEAFP
jgi:DNA repair protein RadA/Sms